MLGLVMLCLLTLVGCAPLAQDQARPERFVDPPEITAAATQRYGNAAGAAYNQVADFLLTQSYRPELIDPQHTEVTVPELTDGISEALVPATATVWQELAAESVAGDREARDSVRLLRFHSWDIPGSTLPPHRRDVLRTQSVTDGYVDVTTSGSGGEALLVAVRHRADLTLAENTIPYDVVLTKDLELTLVPSTDDPGKWLIETFEGELRTRVADRRGRTDDA